MPPYRIVFMGTPDFAVPALVQLTAHPALCQVVGVFCQPDKPAGRGRKVAAGAVSAQAQTRGIAVFTPIKMRSPQTAAMLSALRPDFCVVAAYGRLLPQALLDIPKLGCLNVHASLLPRHRGASPIAHAILAGDAQTGVCIMRMDAGLDTGPVYSQRAVDINSADTCGHLTQKLAALGADLLIASLPDIAAGRLTAMPQDAAQATYAPLLRKEDGLLDFSRPAALLARQVRAFSPWPAAATTLEGIRLTVLRAHADAGGPAAVPGTVLHASGRGVQVACGTGALWLDEVKPAGRKAMPAPAWVAGRGVHAGSRLGMTTIQNP